MHAIIYKEYRCIVISYKRNMAYINYFLNLSIIPKSLFPLLRKAVYKLHAKCWF